MAEWVMGWSVTEGKVMAGRVMWVVDDDRVGEGGWWGTGRVDDGVEGCHGVAVLLAKESHLPGKSPASLVPLHLAQ